MLTVCDSVKISNIQSVRHASVMVHEEGILQQLKSNQFHMSFVNKRKTNTYRDVILVTLEMAKVLPALMLTIDASLITIWPHHRCFSFHAMLVNFFSVKVMQFKFFLYHLTHKHLAQRTALFHFGKTLLFWQLWCLKTWLTMNYYKGINNLK